MAVLSSLLGLDYNPPAQVGAPMMQQKFPEELAPFYKDLLSKSQALYNEKTAEGFKPYTGPSIADFSPEQQQAFTGISGLQGQQAPIFQEAMGMTRSAAAPMTQEQLTSYMSPYQQAVTDIEKREATKLYESQVQPQLAAQAAKIQPFGGSRQAILEGMAADTQQRLLGDIQTKGSEAAYKDAVSRFAQDRTAQGQAGAQLATMAPNQFKAQLGELGALQTIGEEKQKQTQTALDEAFKQYVDEQQYPYSTLGKYQATVTGAPMQLAQVKYPTPNPSTAQTLISGLGTLGSAYGMFTGKNPLNLMTGKKHGGGLSDLPIVYRRDPGPVKNWNVGSGMTSGFEDIHPKQMYPEEFKQREDETIEQWGARIQDLRRAGDKIYYPPRVDAKEVAEEAKKEGISGLNIYQDSMQIGPEAKKLTNEESDAMAGITSVDTSQIQPEVIKPIVVTPPEVNTSRTPLEILMEQSGGSFLKGRDKTVIRKPLDRSGIEGLQVAQTQLNDKINNFMELNKGRMSTEELNKQIETNFGADIKALEAHTKNEGNILSNQMAEDATERGKYFSEKEVSDKDAYTRQQYGNLAQFFARLGTTSPKQAGLAGLVGAGLQAADETLPQAMQTRQDYDTRRDVLASAKRAEERGDKVLTRTEEKSIRKELYSGKGELTTKKRAQLRDAINRDINIAKENIQAANMSYSSEAELVNAETKLLAAEAELAILDLKTNEPSDLNKVFPSIEEGIKSLNRELGGEYLKDMPNNAKIREAAWSQAYKEITKEITRQDITISQENLPKGVVLASMIQRAKDILEAKYGVGGTGSTGGNTDGDEEKATAEELLK